MLKNIEKYTFVLGIIIFVISYILPVDLLNKITELKPLGISTIFICPILGIIGLISSIKRKSIIFVFLNLLLVLSFPIIMFIGNLLFK
ncbi:MAG: hypothetical protein E7C03_09125 [Anaerococcus sp.]|uniref:hypothetical protein n=1 Tax=Peptoniphilaceae TaxID=1570339 RepID=UPI000289E9BC|nr:MULTISPECIES: hypothetical protein [Peptoniphilaceae]MDU2830596.1 hypothetical protein [Anaerococcus sp.]